MRGYPIRALGYPGIRAGRAAVRAVLVRGECDRGAPGCRRFCNSRDWGGDPKKTNPNPNPMPLASADVLSEKVVQLPSPGRTGLAIKCTNSTGGEEQEDEERVGTPRATEAFALALADGQGDADAADTADADGTDGAGIGVAAGADRSPEAKRIARVIAKALHTSEEDSGILVDDIKALKETVSSEGGGGASPAGEEAKELALGGGDAVPAAPPSANEAGKRPQSDNQGLVALEPGAVKGEKKEEEKKKEKEFQLADLRSILKKNAAGEKRKRDGGCEDTEDAEQKTKKRKLELKQSRGLCFSESVKTHDGLSLVHTCEYVGVG